MFQSLDFLYVPSRHPDREIAYYTEVLGGTLLFRVKGMGTEVSAVRLSEEGPLVLLAEHLKGEGPILICRVENRGEAVRRLEQRGWHRLAIYELTRPEANTHFLGLTQPPATMNEKIGLALGRDRTCERWWRRGDSNP